MNLVGGDDAACAQHAAVCNLAYLRRFRGKVPQLEVFAAIDVVGSGEPNGHGAFRIVVALNLVEGENDVLEGFHQRLISEAVNHFPTYTWKVSMPAA